MKLELASSNFPKTVSIRGLFLERPHELCVGQRSSWEDATLRSACSQLLMADHRRHPSEGRVASGDDLGRLLRDPSLMFG